MGTGSRFRSQPRPEVRRKASAKQLPDAVALALKAGFVPDELQTQVLRSQARQGILNCSRQWGKSTVGAAIALHRVVTTPGAMVVVASPTEAQSAELMLKIGDMAAELGLKWKRDRARRVSMVFPNRSRIVGVGGSARSARGLSKVSLMLVDEAAWVPEELYAALRPMLAITRGNLWLMSTPGTTRGFFYEAWEHGGNNWERVMARAPDCPRFGAEWLEGERRDMGRARFEREYMGEFAKDKGAVFERELVERALYEHAGAIDLGLLEWKKKRKQ